jgi:hypothetical protein
MNRMAWMNAHLQQRGRVALSGLLLLGTAVGAGALGQNPATATPGGPGPLAALGVTAPNPAATSVPRQPEPVAVGNGIMLSAPVTPALSRKLSDMPLSQRNRPLKLSAEKNKFPEGGHINGTDPVIQSTLPSNDSVSPMAPLFVNFEGMDSSVSGAAPPDTDGDVGPNHYVQMVNNAIAVWNKSGTLLVGPVDINVIWGGTGQACEYANDGDPIVLYDQMANRWMVSQFTADAPYNECIAVSQTADPTGSYWVYSFQLSTTNFPDYPHFGIWPDGYYMGVNQFDNGSTFSGSRPYVFERSKMLLGQTARFVTTTGPLGVNSSLVQPADLDGATLPPAGAPNYFVEANTTLNLYRFHVDWNNTANTTWTAAGAISGAAAYTSLCNSNCIPQPSTSQKLSGVGSRMMYRLAYRNFGGTEVLIANHNVNANGFAGVRWYEIRNPATTPSVFQQGSYAPADGVHRWMGSVAQDRDGNMLAGFSVSSSSVYPGIRYAGRGVSDPLGTFTVEGTWLTGNGYQSGVDRWGDYSAMSVDPTDDCTFWFTTEYNSSGGWGWHTRIASAKFNNCGTTPPTNTPTATFTSVPTATRTNTPVPPTATRTNTPVPPTATATVTNTPPPGSTATFTPTATNTATVTNTPPPGSTATFTPTATNTPNGGPTATPCTIQFSDVTDTSAYYYTPVYYLACNGILGGYADGTFRPGNNTTRGQLAKIVGLGFGLAAYTPPNGQTFADVPPTGTFWGVIEAAAHAGVVSGYACGGSNPATGAAEPCDDQSRPYFRPANLVTRAQLSKIVVIAAGWSLRTPPAPTFSDVPFNSSFYGYVEAAVCHGIINGYADGTFRPSNNATRGQISKIVYLALTSGQAACP